MSDTEEIYSRIESLDDNINQVLMLLKGSTNLGIEGVIPTMKRMDDSIEDLHQWKQLQEQYKKWDEERTAHRRKVWGNAVKGLAWVIGGLSTIIGIFELVKSAF